MKKHPSNEWEQFIKSTDPNYNAPAVGAPVDLATGDYGDGIALVGSPAMNAWDSPADLYCHLDKDKNLEIFHKHSSTNTAISYLIKNDGSYIEFKLPSFGKLQAHTRSNSAPSDFYAYFIYKDENGVETTFTSPNIGSRKFDAPVFNNFVCETNGRALNFGVADPSTALVADFRDSVTVRIGGAQQAAVNLFGITIEENAAVPLKAVIDSANVIYTGEAGNLGDSPGQYPQQAYDDFLVAINAALDTYNTRNMYQSGYNGANNKLREAIQIFFDSKIASGVYNPKTITFKQEGRLVILNEMTNVAIYNPAGVLLFSKKDIQEVEIPKSVGNGFFIIKTDSGAGKLYLD